MSNLLNVAHCPECGSVFQKNLRNLCGKCSAEMDRSLQEIDRRLRYNRQMNNEQLSEATGIPEGKIRHWIRQGRIKLYDYPNLHDNCDRCSAPIRKGIMCLSCANRIEDEITRALELERLEKERQRRINSYISKNE